MQTLFTAVLFFPGLASILFAADYSQLRATAIKKCEAIAPAEYQSGLFFNPDGYRSYYVRSECFQRTAVQFRDDTLCSNVKRRYSILSSSWGYSQENCRKLVAEGIAADRDSLEKVKREYRLNPVRLRDFRVERNGNGHDFDIIPSFTGSYGHGYVLRLEVLQPVLPLFRSTVHTGSKPQSFSTSAMAGRPVCGAVPLSNEFSRSEIEASH